MASFESITKEKWTKQLAVSVLKILNIYFMELLFTSKITHNRNEYHGLVGFVWFSSLFSPSVSVWEQLFWEGKFKIPSSLAVTKGGKLLISKLNWPFWNYPLWRMALWPPFLLKGRDIHSLLFCKTAVKFCWENKWRDSLLKSNPSLSGLTPLSLGQADERFPPPSPPSIARNSRENLRGGEQGREDRWKEGVRQERTGDAERRKEIRSEMFPR